MILVIIYLFIYVFAYHTNDYEPTKETAQNLGNLYRTRSDRIIVYSNQFNIYI